MKISLYTRISLFLFLFSTTAFSQKISGMQLSENQRLQADIWKDTDGNFINAHGGSMLYHQGTYYWFGEIKKGKTRLLPGDLRGNYRVSASGISCYSSKDLKKWKFEKVSLGTVYDAKSDLDTGKVIERPKVIYNQKTRQFVMWVHVDSQNYNDSRAGVAVSSNPTGPYQYLGSIKPNGHDSGDITIFKDDDGSAYLIYSSNDNDTIFISQLSKDFCSVTDRYFPISKNQKRGAPILFRFEKQYYLITSGSTGWTPNASSYAVCDSLFGQWKSMGNPCVGPFSETTFSSQGTFVLPVDTKKGKYLFMADRWNKTDLENSRYLWLPVEVKGEIVNITWSAKVP